MSQIKKAWLNPWSNDLFALTLESAHLDYQRISAQGMYFPNVPTPEHPLRHTVVIGLLSREDLITLHNVISEYLD